MRHVAIYFDESIPIIDIIRSVTAMGCTLRGTGDGSLKVVPIEHIEIQGIDENVVPFPEAARCES